MNYFRFPTEFLCALLSGLGAFWLGALQFIPIYHTLHDVFGVHTQLCTTLFLAIYAGVVLRELWSRRDNYEEDEGEIVSFDTSAADGVLCELSILVFHLLFEVSS